MKALFEQASMCVIIVSLVFDLTVLINFLYYAVENSFIVLYFVVPRLCLSMTSECLYLLYPVGQFELIDDQYHRPL